MKNAPINIFWPSQLQVIAMLIASIVWSEIELGQLFCKNYNFYAANDNNKIEVHKSMKTTPLTEIVHNKRWKKYNHDRELLRSCIASEMQQYFRVMWIFNITFKKNRILCFLSLSLTKHFLNSNYNWVKYVNKNFLALTITSNWIFSFILLHYHPSNQSQ